MIEYSQFSSTFSYSGKATMTNCIGWTVRHIEVEPDSSAVVTLTQGSERVRFRAADFGVGRPREAAALAKFAAKSGLGNVRRLFAFLVALPTDFAGPLPLPLQKERCHAEW